MGEDIPKEHHVHRVGEWLPSDHRIQQNWLSDTVQHVDKHPKDLQPVMKEFKRTIEEDTRLYILINSMLEQVPSKKPYNHDPTGKHHQVRDLDHLCRLLNHIITTAPGWSEKAHRLGLVGLPLHALFDWPMGTPSGWALFLDPKFNAVLRKVLDAWGEFLSSKDSVYVLNGDKNSWLSSDGKKDLSAVANVGKTDLPFEKLFQCDPSAECHGFTSWDSFFTRLFHEDVRPVAAPDHDEIIANACESTPYRVAYDVSARDKFWVKGQPYSVLDMLARDELSEQFVGGTVYQAFLSALSYHRWHTPVSGKIVKVRMIDGTYYSEPLFEGFGDPKGPDVQGQSDSQGYITATATRALIFIEADNPAIGLMCFMPVGMVEVSTCDVTVKEGQHVKKGDQLGMFHFGGSTHCLFFRKGVDVKGFPEPADTKSNVPVRGELAVVRSKA